MKYLKLQNRANSIDIRYVMTSDHHFKYDMCERMEVDGYVRLYRYTNKHLHSIEGSHPIGVKVLSSDMMTIRIGQYEIVAPFGYNVDGNPVNVDGGAICDIVSRLYIHYCITKYQMKTTKKIQ